VDGDLAAALATTRLRVGYGQTEASPGVALGAPGEWRAGILGRPLGCEVRVHEDGELAFRGPNACLGAWHDGALHVLAPDRWVRSGDLARAEADGTLLFRGRVSDAFKLANGRFVQAGVVEAELCARVAGVRAALVSPSADGMTLRLALTCDGPLPTPAQVAPALGALARVPLELVAVAADAWVRTPKGEVDRRWPVGRDAR
jgi:long-subunit acyl-CoA synthetase (AMP-forming)